MSPYLRFLTSNIFYIFYVDVHKIYGQESVYTPNVHKREIDIKQRSRKIVTDSDSFSIIKSTLVKQYKNILSVYTSFQVHEK